MESLPIHKIKSAIPNFAGYDTEEHRGLSDEQIRGVVGESLAALPSALIDALSPEDRALYDHVLLRSEFADQAAFAKFAHHATPESIGTTLEADLEVLDAARQLAVQSPDRLSETMRQLDEAMHKRDVAMLGQ